MELPFRCATVLVARLHWYFFKLPLTLLLIIVGLLLEALIGLPFALLCWLNARRGQRQRSV